ncbi:hypothetical protein KXQ82_15350 [Mucilaginibacter sp. HMF5004]|uniref:DUF6717 family protein n=1 Tax=Mucilaginibacter rivuli TaxID=2857527 RepID=UPI001C5DA8DA|nr:DUF6717 family protein [Mucilaginibacter rivuli]MBW4891101.1 hypothetical protein [Mucilaginibacter rivuli]
MINIKKLHFKKNASEKWFLSLPEWNGGPEELEMVSGADTLLDILSEDGSECILYMSESQFEGAHVIELLAEREPDKGGGGDYILKVYNGEVIDLKIWLCEVTRWVWGKLPVSIYFSRTGNG